jgi:hypothetical protein
MGNIFGDEKMEIVAVDKNMHILAWTYDGKSFGSTFPEDYVAANIPAAEACTSIFKDHIHSCGTPALADLDGDGLAEVVAFDCFTSTLRAWHGDGRGFISADGAIATLPSIEAAGVSVADLDGDGVIDFFTAGSWVQLAPDGKVTVIAMLPGMVSTWCQDTIADLDGDGTAEILIGTMDGQVAVYQTHKRLIPSLVQWPAGGGDYQHTGCWRPKPRSSVSADRSAAR